MMRRRDLLKGIGATGALVAIPVAIAFADVIARPMDDSAELQALIDAAALKGGGVIRLDAGREYRLTRAIVVGDNITLYGGYFTTQQDAPLFEVKGKNCVISHCIFANAR